MTAPSTAVPRTVPAGLPPRSSGPTTWGSTLSLDTRRFSDQADALLTPLVDFGMPEAWLVPVGGEQCRTRPGPLPAMSRFAQREPPAMQHGGSSLS